jgi:secreted trypsin-like serine protease
MVLRKLTREPVWVTLLAALVAALVSVFVFLQSGKPAQAADGTRYSTKIIGGTAVPDGKYKFVAALRNTNFGSTAFEQQFCGGTLIDHDSVLTAAHCVYGRSVSPLRVTVGRTVLDSNQGQTRSVSRKFVHRFYDPSLDDAYDAAVLKLRRPVSGIPPIKLATSSQDFLETPGRNATVAGWGNTIGQPAGGNAGSSFPNRMREAQVPIVSDNQAASVYGSDYFKRLMVAAGEAGKDTCQGDSGGPMFAKPGGKFTQIGITSFGTGCGADGYPGVYAEVNASSIRSFITNAASK